MLTSDQIIAIEQRRTAATDRFNARVKELRAETEAVQIAMAAANRELDGISRQIQEATTTLVSELESITMEIGAGITDGGNHATS